MRRRWWCRRRGRRWSWWRICHLCLHYAVLECDGNWLVRVIHHHRADLYTILTEIHANSWRTPAKHGTRNGLEVWLGRQVRHEQVQSLMLVAYIDCFSSCQVGAPDAREIELVPGRRGGPWWRCCDAPTRTTVETVGAFRTRIVLSTSTAIVAVAVGSEVTRIGAIPSISRVKIRRARRWGRRSRRERGRRC